MLKKMIAILLLIAMIPATLLGVGASLPAYYAESYYAELPQMYEKLKSTTGRKIVIVGGSNVAFGVDSVLLEELLAQCGYEYTVCNFGLYAAVGTSAMLELSEPYLKEGDIVVLAIEPTSETFSTYFGATAFWKCTELNPEMVLDVNSDQRSALIGNYIDYLQERLDIFKTGILPSAEGVYAKASFDQNCNMIYERTGNAMALGYDTGNPVDLAEVSFEAEFLEQVTQYCKTAEDKKAQVLMSFSPVNRGAMASADADAVYEYFLRCREAFPCRIISDPNDYIMDSGWFYDSNFHLNTAGTQVRTYQLANDLLNYFGYFKALEFELPEMPKPIAEAEISETDTSDFLFQPLGENGYIVSGITDDGKEKSSLTVPSSYEGKPVVGFTVDAFAGHTALVELTLPGTVESIPDGAFYGCTNLIRLVLLHSQSTPTVGGQLLDGTENLTIYVPSSAYSLYRDGAGCAANPWEGYLSRIVPY